MLGRVQVFGQHFTMGLELIVDAGKNVLTAIQCNLFHAALSHITEIPITELLCTKLGVKCLTKQEHQFLREYCLMLKPLTVALSTRRGKLLLLQGYVEYLILFGELKHPCFWIMDHGQGRCQAVSSSACSKLMHFVKEILAALSVVGYQAFFFTSALESLCPTELISEILAHSIKILLVKLR